MQRPLLTSPDVSVFEQLESSVRSYCRSFPAVFSKGHGAWVIDECDRSYIDFWCGAGVLNYGHNPPGISRKVVEYIENGGIIHSLDLHTTAKRDFLCAFQSNILGRRGLSYRLQFPGPTGTNAVEAALKLARRVTGRQKVIFFTGGFHGVTLGSLAVTSNSYYRDAAGVPLDHAVELPFGDMERVKDYVEKQARDGDQPAAIILETLQAEGGVNPADFGWLQQLANFAKERGILLIVDDIQAGCGRTGPFFSFEPAGITPDIICLSKAIGGFGLPISLVLINPEYDVWKPGEHNGTFRGNNLSFVAGAAALRQYWSDDALQTEVKHLGRRAYEALSQIAKRHERSCGAVRGRGLLLALPLVKQGMAKQVSRAAFERGLLVETAGPCNEVVKILPPLNIDEGELIAGLNILSESVDDVLATAH